MADATIIAGAAVLLPLTLLVAHFDVRYRRIPNALTLGVLSSGLAVHLACRGGAGLRDSLLGCLFAFSLMLAVRCLTGLGAGDVKLFGAIGALLGPQNVLPAFLFVVLLGGALALAAVLRAGMVRQTWWGVYRIFAGMLPGGLMPAREEFARSGLTIPYGVAVAGGGLLQALRALS